MPVQPFGKADPYYDALRVMSNQNIQGAALGDTGAGGVLENKIYVWHADGSTLDLFDPNAAGFTLALAAAAAGDVVVIPACTISGNYTITKTIRGLDRNRSIFSGTIILNSGALVSDLTFTGSVTANNSVVAHDCSFVTTSSPPALTVTGTLGSSPYIYNSVIETLTTGGSDYALVVTGYCYIEFCDILSLANAASVNNANATFSHCYFSAAGAGTSTLAVNLVNGRLANCLIEGYAGHGLRFASGAATVTNTTMRVFVDPTTQYALYVTGSGLTLSDCNFNSETGLTLCTLLDGDRAKWNHTHPSTGQVAAPPVVVDYDSIGAPYITVTHDGDYNAIPALARAANGTLIMIYRKATGHTSSKGVIVKKTSTDDGATWSAETTIVNDATYDAREPGLTKLANGDLILAYVLYNQAGLGSLLPGDQVYVKKSVDNGVNWSASVTVTTGFTSHGYASASVVELANGDLLMPTYGDDIGDTLWSCKVSKSTDAGATWAFLATIADGDALGRRCDEPNIVLMNDGSLLCAHQMEAGDQSSDFVGISTSTDSGATWATPTMMWALWGNPHMTHLANDHVIITTREWVTRKIIARSTTDGGTTWSDSVVLDTSTYFEMEYAQGLELYPGLIGVVYSVQLTSDYNGDADIRWLWMGEGGTGGANDALVASSLTVYGGDITIIGGGQFKSTTPTGTAPLVVASTTLVDNLNADLLDGFHASAFAQNLSDLNDVTTAGAVAGDVLVALTPTTFGFTAPNVGATSIYNETQSADGISLTYYLTNYAAPGTIRVYIDGVRQPASDDTAPTDIVSFGAAPDLGAVLLFDYEMDLT